MDSEIDTGDGRTYVLDESLHPVGVEDDTQGVSREPNPGELAHDFPHGGYGPQYVDDDAGNPIGYEDPSRQMSVDLSQDQ